LLVGLGTMFWSIWLSRNDVVFNRTSITSYMQVIFRVTYWTRKQQLLLRWACRLMETLTWISLPNIDGGLVIE
jgi:hypothetical protein